MVRIHHDGDLIDDEPRPIASMLEGNATYHQQLHPRPAAGAAGPMTTFRWLVVPIRGVYTT